VSPVLCTNKTKFRISFKLYTRTILNGFMYYDRMLTIASNSSVVNFEVGHVRRSIDMQSKFKMQRVHRTK